MSDANFLDKFWAEDLIAHGENCFTQKAKQVALGIRMSDECVFAELGEEGTPWAHTPRERRIELNKRYNGKSEKIVGLRLLKEEFEPEDAKFPEIKRIGEFFGGRYVWKNDTEWLESDITTPEELEAQLDRIDKLDVTDFMLPANWVSECRRIYETYGKKPGQVRHVRGPVTLACSIYGIENLIFLILDEPDLAKRFSDTITNVIIKMADLMDAESGRGKTPGFSFADDNCCMLNPEMYELFGYPVLKKVFETYSPNEDDSRYQHSDSAMGHLLPILGRVNLTGVNFGPTVMVDEIRRYLPKARIDGCLAPFTFMRNDREGIITEVKRDCELAKKCGRGVNIATAGSINDGSMLESMRLVMEVIAEFGQY